jgi:broad specificity phosphatase PhoE
MKPKRIVLIRHGESQGNVDKSIYGQIPDYTLELTELGKQQAGQAGREIARLTLNESLFFYVSPMWRTRSTFEHIARNLGHREFRYVEEPRIREQEWGHLRGPEESKQVDRDRDAYGTFYFRIPDGESAADVYDRVSDFFGSMHRDFDKPDYPQNSVIVTHGMTIRLFLMRWYHWTVEEFELLSNPANCQLVVLERNERDKYTLVSELRRRERASHGYSRPIVV